MSWHQSPNPSIESIMQDISAIAAVTGGEARLYHWLLNVHWKRIARDAVEPAGLTVSFAGDSQLVVSWTGVPGATRRTVLLAHADREGYWIESVRRQDGSWYLLGRTANGQPVEDLRKGTAVVVIAGRDIETSRTTGRIASVTVDEAPAAGEESGYVLIECDCDDPSDYERLLRSGPITAHHMFFPDGDIEMQATGDVISWGIDNAAGVAVATSCVTEAVLRNLPVNISVVYTLAEEAGFLGVLSMIRNINDVVSEAEDALWVVVDCSDENAARTIGLDDWRAHRFSEDLNSLRNEAKTFAQRSAHLSAKTAVVRLEDQLSVYDLSAARLLYQSALGARGFIQEDQGDRTRPHGADRDRVRPWEMGLAGVFVGGLCEASILAHLDELLDGMGRSVRPQDRVGCIAIPLSNYRHIGGLKLRPETTYVSAMLSAYHILLEAAGMHRWYRYPGRSLSGFRGPRGAKRYFGGRTPVSRDALVGIWVERALGGSRLEELAREWCGSVGNELRDRIQSQ